MSGQLFEYGSGVMEEELIVSMAFGHMEATRQCEWV